MNTVYSSLIGIPHEEKNCWQIVQEFYRLAFGVQLKTYFDGADISSNHNIKSLIYSNMGDFESVPFTDAKDGDIVLLRIWGVESHIGVLIEGGKILHSLKGHGCVVDRVHKWSGMIVGFYRHKAS